MKHFILPLGALLALLIPGLRRSLATANAEATTGTHFGTETKLADAAFGSRHLLVKVGSDADHVALGDAGSLPLGLCDDQPSAAEDPINVIVLGAAKGTRRMTAASALAANTDVYAAANGLVQALPAVAGSYYRVGRTRGVAQLASAGVYLAEVEPCQPEKVTVLTAPVGTAATDVAALYTALQAGPVLLKSL